VLVPCGDDNVRPVVREARVRVWEDAICEGDRIECQKKRRDVRMGKQDIQCGVEAVTCDGGVAELDEDCGEGGLPCVDR
jgi:hypothetical protein